MVVVYPVASKERRVQHFIQVTKYINLESFVTKQLCLLKIFH